MQKVNFRYSDTDFIAYLLTLGYKHNQIEVQRDRYNKIKAFVYFEENKEQLLKLSNQYQNGSLNVNVLEFTKNRRRITKLIKSAIFKYQAQEI